MSREFKEAKTMEFILWEKWGKEWVNPLTDSIKGNGWARTQSVSVANEWKEQYEALGKPFCITIELGDCYSVFTHIYAGSFNS